ncbi:MULTISPECIES: hypothetical protein [Methylomonas]|uniref:hypothetical protein n=1 Tax=Methylomonas TaxID=416 RepID=UPI00167FE4AB|nr:hypothetical protein [Methylomonas rhizoryzae]
MNNESDLLKDVITGITVLAGIHVLMSGEFAYSTLLFGAASLSTNLGLKRDKLDK